MFLSLESVSVTRKNLSFTATSKKDTFSNVLSLFTFSPVCPTKNDDANLEGHSQEVVFHTSTKLKASES